MVINQRSTKRRVLIIAGILAVSLIILLVTGSCTNNYLFQASKGHFQIMRARQPIEKLLQSDTLGDFEKSRLQLVADVHEFAIRELKLPDNKSFTTYADIGRDYPGWNVFAAPQLSLEPKTWCYPVAGCVVYHGYFEKDKAFDYAEQLKSNGYDVIVSPFTAYSTRGWFKDPVLSNHLRYDSIRLSGLIIHELAHQRFYYKEDSRVSESFAVTVERAGVKKWLESLGMDVQAKEAMVDWREEDEFVARLFDYKKELESIYNSGLVEIAMLQRKDSILDNAARELNIDRDRLNNAFFVPVSTYNSLVPSFQALLDSCEGDFEEFYGKIADRYK